MYRIVRNDNAIATEVEDNAKIAQIRSMRCDLVVDYLYAKASRIVDILRWNGGACAMDKMHVIKRV